LETLNKNPALLDQLSTKAKEITVGARGILKQAGSIRLIPSRDPFANPIDTFVESDFHYIKRIESHPAFSNKVYTSLIEQPEAPDQGKKSPRYVAGRQRPPASPISSKGYLALSDAKRP
jgi:hypothetical protein